MREYLKKGTLIQLTSGDCYEITGDSPIGEGGGSIIYSASRIIFSKTSSAYERISDIDYAVKECFPVSNRFDYLRNSEGEIVSASENIESDNYLLRSKLNQLSEKTISSKIFKKGFRITPVLYASEQCALSFDKGQTFHVANNTITVMESVHEKGTSLKALLEEQKRIPTLQAARVIEQLLFALDEVHKAGYLYLDIQAGNVFIKGGIGSNTEFITLMDFGAARPVEEDGKTAPITDRVLFSTDGYTPPEMLLQNDGTLRLDCRADLYSVGYLFLYMLTGKKYSSKELFQIKDGHYITGFRQKRMDCPKYLLPLLHEILGKTLSTDIDKRYPSVSEALKDIQTLASSLQPKTDGVSAVKYDAFVCYKHGEIDSAVALQLQHNLEHLTVPPRTYTGKDKHPIKRVFVDEGELASCSDFGFQINEALKNSRYLIVVCSKTTSSSEWVQLEIETFLKYHDRKQILAVLTDGEPSEAFPEELKKTELHEEVFAADVRSGSKKETLKKVKKDALYRIAAPMLGTTYDSFRQRKQSYYYKRVFAVSSCIILLMSGFLTFSLWQNNVIQKQYLDIQKRQARILAGSAEELLDKGERAASIKVAQEALKLDPTAENAQLNLEDALNVYKDGSHNIYPYSPLEAINFDASLLTVGAFDAENGVFCTADINGTFYFLDAHNYHIISTCDLRSTVSSHSYEWEISVCFCPNDLAVILYDNNLIGYNYQAGEEKWHLTCEDWTGVSETSLSTSGSAGICTNTDKTMLYKADLDYDGNIIIAAIYTENGEVSQRITVPVNQAGSWIDLSVIAVSDDEKSLVVGINGYLDESLLTLLDISSGDTVWTDCVENLKAQTAVFDGDNVIAVYSLKTLLPETLAQNEPYSVRYYLPSGQIAWNNDGYYMDRGGKPLIDVVSSAGRYPEKIIKIVNSSQVQSFSDEGELLYVQTYGDKIAGDSTGRATADYLITADGGGRKLIIGEGVETNGKLIVDLGIEVNAAYYDNEGSKWFVIPSDEKKLYVFGLGTDPGLEPVSFFPQAQDAILSPNGRYCLIGEMTNENLEIPVSLWDMEKEKKLWSINISSDFSLSSLKDYFWITDEFVYYDNKNLFYLYSADKEIRGTWSSTNNLSVYEGASAAKETDGTLHVILQYHNGIVLLQGEELQEVSLYSIEELKQQCLQFAGKEYTPLSANLTRHYLVFHDDINNSEQSPDKSYIYIMDTETMQFIQLPEIAIDYAIGNTIPFYINEEGDLLLIRGKDHSLHLLSLPDGQYMETIDLEKRSALSFMIDPKKERVVIQTNDNMLLNYNILTHTMNVCGEMLDMSIYDWTFYTPDSFWVYYQYDIFSPGDIYFYSLTDMETYIPLSIFPAGCQMFSESYAYYINNDNYICRMPIRSLEELIAMGDQYLVDKEFSDLELRQYGIETNG